jgi:hypothetical protein
LDIRKRSDLWWEPRALLTLGNSVKAAREVLALPVLVRVRVPQLRVGNEGGVPQQAEGPRSDRGRCEFESHRPHQVRLTWSSEKTPSGFEFRGGCHLAPVAQFGRGNRLKPGINAGSNPAGSTAKIGHGLVAQRGRGTTSRASPVEVRILPRPLEARAPGKGGASRGMRAKSPGRRSTKTTVRR